MSRTITIRISDELASWLEDTARRRGMTRGQIIREQLVRARSTDLGQPFIRLAGSIRGSRNLSNRSGFRIS